MPEELASELRDAAKQRADFAELTDLLIVQRMLGPVGAGEVAHQQRDAVAFRADVGRDRRRLLDGEAEPVHAGVDVQRRAAGKAAGRDEVVPFGELDQAVDHRPRIGLDESLSRRVRKIR